MPVKTRAEWASNGIGPRYARFGRLKWDAEHMDGLFGIAQNDHGFELSVCAASGPLPNDFFDSVGG
jgi:hypothetical protein